ncbi:MAG: hypothetical protein AAF649_11090 [Verrucomicrobiota bacterium]
MTEQIPAHFPATTRIDPLGSIFSIVLIRIWLGIRSLQAGIEKFSGTQIIAEPTSIDGKANTDDMITETVEKFYAFSNYQGVPLTLYDSLSEEPLIHSALLEVFNNILGPVLLLLGITLLLGIATRTSLLAMGLLYTSLTFGLILLNQSSGIAWLAAHILLIGMMLMFAHRNRLELGNLLAHHTRLKFIRNL